MGYFKVEHSREKRGAERTLWTIVTFWSEHDVARGGHEGEAYTLASEDHKILRWTSNDRCVPIDIVEETRGLFEEPWPFVEEHRAVLDAETTAFLDEYRERMKDHEPDGEELFEMRAAFGEGTTVVNVITGKRTKL